MTSARWQRTVIAAMVLALVACGRPAEARAQVGGGPVAVGVVQGLNFGSILPGATESVPVSDTWRRAEIRIEATGQVEFRFTLPAVLSAPSGAQIPLSFGNADAMMMVGKNPSPVSFNPAIPYPVKVPQGQGTATVYLGATARPAASQAAGVYQATLVLTVSSIAN